MVGSKRSNFISILFSQHHCKALQCLLPYKSGLNTCWNLFMRPMFCYTSQVLHCCLTLGSFLTINFTFKVLISGAKLRTPFLVCRYVLPTESCHSLSLLGRWKERGLWVFFSSYERYPSYRIRDSSLWLHLTLIEGPISKCSHTGS
jgi:hypothetical protein